MSDTELPEDQLDSWKEIAAYLRRSVRTVHRWEREEGLPVRRHNHSKANSVHASRNELDIWRRDREAKPVSELTTPSPTVPNPQTYDAFQQLPWRWVAMAASLALLALVVALQHWKLEIRLH